MSVYNRQNQEFVPLAETSGILQNMTSSNIEYVVCADGETPEYNTGIRLSPSKKLKFSQNVGVSYVRVVGNTTGDIIVTPNDEASSGGGSTTRIINHVQDWKPNTLYPTGTLVIYNNVLYKCVVPNHKTIFDPADWVVIGAGNDSGKGISVWNSQTNYKVDDIILHGNTLYVCVNEHVSSTEFGDDTDYWVVITDNAGTVLPDWQAREKYEKDEIVNVGGFIYRCKSPHISRDTFATMNDVVGDEDYWELISWVDWHTETQYLKDQIVYCDGALWRCLANHVSDNTSISNDSDKWIKICGYTLPVASDSELGGIKVGNGLTITDDGTLSTNAIEVVKVNNEPLPLDDKSVNIDLTDYVRSNDITAVLHYKGTKQDYNDLPIAGNIIGDVWNIVNSDTTHSVKAGDNVAWNGSTWDVLSGTVDLSGYVIKEIGKGLSTEDFTSVLKAKLEGIETGANAYTLPIATENILGGVKIGSGIDVQPDGTISVTMAPNNDIVTWVGGTSYKAGQYVIYNNNLYECKEANKDANFDEEKWQLIGGSSEDVNIRDWESEEDYAVGDLVIYNNVLYQCITANNDATFDSDKWTSIGALDADLKEWKSKTSYKVGNFVIKNNKLYKCIEANKDAVFDSDKWQEIGDMSDIAVWESGTSYAVDDYVIYDNRVYQCDEANDDTDFDPTKWTDVGAIQSIVEEWQSGKDYAVGALVIKDKVIYKCTTANDDLMFDPDKWAVQIDNTKAVTVWTSGTGYGVGQYVVYQGVIYKCKTANNDSVFDKDKWDVVDEPTGFVIGDWKTKTVYKANQFVRYDDDVYMCLVGHTSDVFRTDYNSDYWLKVDQSVPHYKKDKFYAKDSIMCYEGQLYHCLISHKSTGDTPFDADGYSKSWTRNQAVNNGICYGELNRIWSGSQNVVVDCGKEIIPKEVDVTFKNAKIHITDFNLYGSTDGTTFTLIGSGSNNAASTYTVAVGMNNVSFRYLKVESVNCSYVSGADRYSWVSNVTVVADNSDKWELYKSGGGGVVTWEANTDYKANTFIVRNGDLYLCLTDHTSSSDITTDITAGKWVLINRENSNVNNPIGTVIAYMGTTAPANYLACDGTVYNIADYQELANFINAQFGSYDFFGGDGTTTFAVPDLRGEFLRGTGTNSHENQGNGADVGVHQDGTEHANVWNYANTLACVDVGTDNGGDWYPKNLDNIHLYSPRKYVELNIKSQNSSSAIYTSRPTNTSVLYCIRYNSPINAYRHSSFEYALGDTAMLEGIPAGCFLECTTSGTTGATAPVITSVTAGDTITDGTVVWTVRQCLPTSGGVLIGENPFIKGATLNGYVTISAGSRGGYLVLYGANNPDVPAGADLVVGGTDQILRLINNKLLYGYSTNPAKLYDLGGSAIVAKSLGETGYIKYASGMIIQFGRKIVNLNSGSVVQGTLDFPISFTTTNYAFASTACPKDTSSPFEYSITAKQKSLVGIIFPSGITSTRMYLDYVAIGY